MPIFSLHIGLSFFVRAVKLAKFSYTLRKTINLGASWSFCNLLSFTPSLPSKNMLTDVNICRLRSGGALSVLYWYNWGPRPYYYWLPRHWSSPIHINKASPLICCCYRLSSLQRYSSMIICDYHRWYAHTIFEVSAYQSTSANWNTYDTS